MRQLLRFGLAILGITSAAWGQINETFSGTNLPQGFTLQAGSATVAGGVLTLTSGCVQLPGTYSRAQGLTIEADIKINNAGIGDFNIWGLYDQVPRCETGPLNGYYTSWFPTGSDSGDDNLYAITTGNGILLTHTAARIAANQWYKIKQEFLADGTINTYINGARTMTARHSGFTSGYITLRSWQGVEIDNLVVTTALGITPPPCTLRISASSVDVGAIGFSGTVTVSASASTCEWTASRDPSALWIRLVSGIKGVGDGSVGYTVDTNQGPFRSATLTIAGQQFIVSQASGLGNIRVSTNLTNCVFAISGPSEGGRATYPGAGMEFIIHDLPPGTYTVSFSPVTGYLTPEPQTQILAPGGLLIVSAHYELLTSFFDDFRTLFLWRVAGQVKENDTTGCTRGLAGTELCVERVKRSSPPGSVSLEGYVDPERRGAALNWKREKYPLPARGTFAARVKYEGAIADDPDSHASVKAFFTYYTDPADGCIHMEQDFELLTGTSRLYVHPFGADDSRIKQSENKGPLMVTLTHYHAPEPACSAKHNRKIATQDHLGKRKDGYLTLVVTVDCTNCDRSDANPKKIISKYYALSEGMASLSLGETGTDHDIVTHPLDPLFSLWWINPADAKQPISATTAAPQSMHLDWFYWTRQVMDEKQLTSISLIGKDCDDRSLRGPNKCP